ncbi:MAG: Rossmann-like domain-containing protein [Desulfosalsimonas sp.]
METIQRIKSHLAEEASGHKIADVRIGLGYTAVMLENRQTGLAGTPLAHLRHGCTLFDGMLPLEGKKASGLLKFIESRDPLETAVGLATANSLANTWSPQLGTGDVLEAIDLGSGDHVAMVGNFAPLAGAVRKTGARLTIFEQIKRPRNGLLPSGEIAALLPECTVCLLTATSIINHTFEKIIKSAAQCRSVVLLGASTPLIPGAFSGTPVTCLSGVIVKEPEKLLSIISCGGGMKKFGGVIEKVNLPAAG